MLEVVTKEDNLLYFVPPGVVVVVVVVDAGAGEGEGVGNVVVPFFLSINLRHKLSVYLLGSCRSINHTGTFIIYFFFLCECIDILD